MWVVSLPHFKQLSIFEGTTMSVEIIKDQIFQFLSTDQPEVMAIKGEWNSKKTFSWKKFLKEACSERKLNFEHYSYVYLFDINSLKTFKHKIFERGYRHQC